MKKKLLIWIGIILILIPTIVYSHGGNISGYKDKNSEKIITQNGEHYGYHKEDGQKHYHKVKWDEEKQRWQIKNSFIYYDENLNVIKDTNADTKKIEVTLNRTVDGDTVIFDLIENDNSIKTRFLAIDTPESTTEIEPFGKEASDFTKTKLTNAKKIVLEYDNNSTQTDKYNRHLVWVWVDDKLLQSLLIENGLAQIEYIYGDYKYLEELKEKESLAKANKIGIWQDDIQDKVIEDTSNSTTVNKQNISNENNWIYIVFVVVGIIVFWVKKIK